MSSTDEHLSLGGGGCEKDGDGGGSKRNHPRDDGDDRKPPTRNNRPIELSSSNNDDVQKKKERIVIIFSDANKVTENKFSEDGIRQPLSWKEIGSCSLRINLITFLAGEKNNQKG